MFIMRIEMYIHRLNIILHVSLLDNISLKREVFWLVMPCGSVEVH
jgi:hypothetical protein